MTIKPNIPINLVAEARENELNVYILDSESNPTPVKRLTHVGEVGKIAESTLADIVARDWFNGLGKQTDVQVNSNLNIAVTKDIFEDAEKIRDQKSNANIWYTHNKEVYGYEFSAKRLLRVIAERQ